MKSHEHFEELAALALISELSAEEHKELQVHLTSCVPCRQECKAYEDILSNQLPLLHSERRPSHAPRLIDFAEIRPAANSLRGNYPVLPSLHEIQRPHKDLSPKNVLLGRPQLAYGLCGILILAIGFLGFEIHSQGREAQAQISALTDRISLLNKEAKNGLPALVHEPPIQPKEVRPQQRDDGARMAQRIHDLEDQLKASAEAITSLNNQLQVAEDSDQALAQRVSDTQQQLEKASQDLQAALHDRD